MKLARLKEQSGFTLVEVTVAATTIAITVTAIFGAFNSVETLNLRTRNYTIGTQLVQQQMETYRNTPYTSLNTGTEDISAIMNAYPTLGTPRSATAIITEVDAAGLKRVDIALSYNERGKTRNVQISTYIAARGLNR